MVRAIPALILPRQRAAWLDELLRGVEAMPKLVALVVVMAAGAALYGAVIGMWRGGHRPSAASDAVVARLSAPGRPGVLRRGVEEGR